MEYLDAFDEDKNYLGVFSKDEVHEKGLWHNTVHCWLYDNNLNVYFQIRSNNGKIYTTASGHVQAGEDIKDAFTREIKEEIGIDLSWGEAKLLKVVKWMMDKEKNGKLNKDRAFANVYIFNIKDRNYDFKFVDGEVVGIGKMKVTDVLDLFSKKVDIIDCEVYKNSWEKIEARREDFLLMPNETLEEKYGYILEEIKNKKI